MKSAENIKYALHNGVATVVPALPPFGCEESKYTSPIAGGVVAIMRGGGCGGERASCENGNEERSDNYCCFVASLLVGLRSALFA